MLGRARRRTAQQAPQERGHRAARPDVCLPQASLSAAGRPKTRPARSGLASAPLSWDQAERVALVVALSVVSLSASLTPEPPFARCGHAAVFRFGLASGVPVGCSENQLGACGSNPARRDVSSRGIRRRQAASPATARTFQPSRQVAGIYRHGQPHSRIAQVCGRDGPEPERASGLEMAGWGDRWSATLKKQRKPLNGKGLRELGNRDSNPD